MDPALGTVNLPEIDEERRKRAEAAIAALNQQLTASQAANAADAARFDPSGVAIAAYQPQIAAQAARGQQMVQDVASRYDAHDDGRTALANIWLTGVRGAGIDKMNQMARDAQFSWDKAHPAGVGGGGGGGGGGGRGGGGGGRRRSGASSSGSSLSAAPAQSYDPVQYLAQLLMGGSKPAPRPKPTAYAPPPKPQSRGGTLTRYS